MSDTWKWKVIGLIVSILGTLYLLVPSVFDFKSRINDSEIEVASFAWQRLFPEKKINLGLDLRGGMYLELDIALKEALENRVDILLLEIERYSEKEKFPHLKLTQIRQDHRIKVELNPSDVEAFKKFIREYLGDKLEIAQQSSEEGDVEATNQEPVNAHAGHLILKMRDDYAQFIREATLKQAVEAVRNRIDRYGVAEASIQRQGDDRLIVELPGVKDPDRVIEVIRKTAVLEFKMVDETMDQAQLTTLILEAREQEGVQEGYTKAIVDKINLALAGKLPEETEILFEVERDPVTKDIVNGIPFLLKKRTDITGDMLRNAQVGISDNEPNVNLSFNKMGTKNFGTLTKDNVGKRLAIVLDDVVFSAPVIQTAILNGEARITLGYGSYQSLLKEAEDLALILREGALPASLTIATKTVIGPSLGQDSIRKGVNSLLIATVVIVIFMILYYKWGGVLSTLALILNVLYIFGILSLFQASLTLPGIAGIVLTLGMAVDANVIIFERMREEMRLGRSAKSVVENGYACAMSAIVDANITTFIAGVVLYQFGTGPVKGFATTLMVGILTTMFTAIIVTRIVYDYFIYKRKVQRIII